MSRDSEVLTELTDGITAETESDIEETVHAEQKYQDFVSQQRQERIQEIQNSTASEQRANEEELEQQAQNRADQQLEAEEQRYTDLTNQTARVTRIAGFEQNGDDAEFEIYFETLTGERVRETIPASLPEDTGSKWVRLCEWADVHPSRPGDLRDCIIPIKRKESSDSDTTEVSIHVPPVWGGLNPLTFKAKRFFRKEKTEHVMNSLSTVVLPLVAVVSPLLMFSVSMLALVFVSSTLRPYGALGSFAMILTGVPLAIIATISAAMSIRIYGEIALRGLFFTIVKTVQGSQFVLSRIKPYLFPEQ